MPRPKKSSINTKLYTYILHYTLYSMNQIQQIINETGMSAKEINDYTNRFLQKVIFEEKVNSGEILRARFLNYYSGMML